MADKSKSGKQALLFDVAKGVLIEGDAATPLADDSWFLIDAKATASTLPYSVGNIFKTPDSSNAITPALGDNVYPLTFTKICKVDASISNEKGTIDVTDDCEAPYNAYITDGYTDISGSISAFFKIDDGGAGLNETQKEYLAKFYDILEDDGAGVYTSTDQDDNDIILAVLNNSDQTAEGDVQVWLLIPAILTGITTDKPLKGVQNFDMNFQKAQGLASVYLRTTNASETVF